MATKELPTPLTVRLNEGDPDAKREEIRRYFHETYDANEIRDAVDDDTYYRRADPLDIPIFYYGHTATFLEQARARKIPATTHQPEIESQFAIGVDEMS